jgi:hypothetical protein
MKIIMKNNSTITRVALPGLAIVALALFGSSAAWAQSSGNVATDNKSTVCEIATPPFAAYTCVNPANGNTVPCPTYSSSTPYMTAQIQSSSGAGNSLIITPSLDVGMFTDTIITGAGTLTGSDNQTTGVMVTVTVDGKPARPEVVAGSPPGATGVVYDQRFQQLSVNNLQCGGSTACDIDFILSSMSAHSFNFFYPNLVQGTHVVRVYATLTNPPNTTKAATCIGPGTLTVVQVKAFSQN